MRTASILAALLLTTILATTARADPVEDAARSLGAAANAALAQSAATASGAGDAATGAARDLVASTSGEAQRAVASLADGVASAAPGALGQEQQLVAQVEQAPDPALAQFWRKYADVVEVPHVLGDYAQRRVSSLEDLDRPWLEGARDTAAPVIARLDTGLTVNISALVPLDSEHPQLPQVGTVLGPAFDPRVALPDAGDVAASSQVYVRNNVPGTEVWALDAVADTYETGLAAAHVLLR